MTPRPINRIGHSHGLTLLETVISILLIAVLLAVLLPALSLVRSASYKDACQHNQTRISQALELYLQEHDGHFPAVPVQPGWMYGGVRFTINDLAYPDDSRPLSTYLPCPRTSDKHEVPWCCPADRGISNPNMKGAGTGARSAFQSYGTSYRANSALLTMSNGAGKADTDAKPARSDDVGVRRSEITTAPSRLLVLGDATWYEVAEQTGLNADWHDVPGAGNLLFLDGSVRFLTVRPRDVAGPIVFDPWMSGSASTPQRSIGD